MELKIRRIDDSDDRIGDFIQNEFSLYGEQNGLSLNYDDFCFAAEDDDGSIAGIITGHAYYNEVHISDLIIHHDHRRSGLGSRLVSAVENSYAGKGYEKITVSTYGFQAPEFYRKLGFEIEFIREDKEPKLKKYFLCKTLKP